MFIPKRAVERRRIPLRDGKHLILLHDEKTQRYWRRNLDDKGNPEGDYTLDKDGFDYWMKKE